MSQNSPSALADPSPADIQRAASQWFARNQASDADPTDRAFLDWMADNPEHEAAYHQIEMMWQSDAFGAAIHRARTCERYARRRNAVAGLAAAIALITGAMRIGGVEAALPADHVARIGAHKVVSLEDDTRVELDSASAIDVDYNEQERTVTLRRGRVMVDIAPDQRPFRLVVGDAVIRDVGTSFAAERIGAGTRVAVSDGAVGIRWRGDEADLAVLRAGQAGGLLSNGALPARPANDQLDFGWRRGRVYFSQAPLSEVVARLRRYHKGWIVIADDRIAHLPITGGIDSARPAEAMTELARLSGGELVRVTDRLLILR